MTDHGFTRLRVPAAVRRLAVLVALVALVAGWAAGPAAAAPAPASTGRYYVVAPPKNGQPEFLYEIAAKTLGNGNRYTEIFDLNKDRIQPDGGRLTDPMVLSPGWILILPTDAKGAGVRTGPPPALPARLSPSTSERPTASADVSPAPIGRPVILLAGVGGAFLLLIAAVAVLQGGRKRIPSLASPGDVARPPAPPPGPPPANEAPTRPVLIPVAGPPLPGEAAVGSELLLPDREEMPAKPLDHASPPARQSPPDRPAPIAPPIPTSRPGGPAADQTVRSGPPARSELPSRPGGSSADRAVGSGPPVRSEPPSRPGGPAADRVVGSGPPARSAPPSRLAATDWPSLDEPAPADAASAEASGAAPNPPARTSTTPGPAAPTPAGPTQRRLLPRPGPWPGPPDLARSSAPRADGWPVPERSPEAPGSALPPGSPAGEEEAEQNEMAAKNGRPAKNETAERPSEPNAARDPAVPGPLADPAQSAPTPPSVLAPSGPTSSSPPPSVLAPSGPASSGPALSWAEPAKGGPSGNGDDSPDDFAAELVAGRHRVTASLVGQSTIRSGALPDGVTADGLGSPYGWRDRTQAPPVAILPVLLGENDGRRLFLDLGRCPDVLTVVGAPPDAEAYALRLIWQVLDGGHEVAVLGDDLFRDILPDGCRRLRVLADAYDLKAPGIVVSGRLAGKDVAAARLSRASGGPIPMLVGEVPRARWSLQIAPA